MKAEDIESIILNEYKKHPNLEWAKLASLKIQSEILRHFDNDELLTLKKNILTDSPLDSLNNFFDGCDHDWELQSNPRRSFSFGMRICSKCKRIKK